MGIVNKNNALYMATGIDNSGLYSGKAEAMGILKAMSREITSFDVFGGIGISAGVAFAKAAAGAYEFEKQFEKSMKEVATLSSGIKGSLTDYMNSVVDITREVPVLANDAAKALYQIVSAGHDGADGMKILEVSAKAAIGGVTDTATAADAITSILNAYKMSANDAENVSNQLFATVKLGKTTFGELGHSIAQVAPIAAAYGVEIDQVLAAVATLTKQGTPTAQAMTQIRAAIVGVSKYLGDGAYNGRTFQEALEMVRQKAGGSEAKLREFIPEIEAVNGLLGLTGQNAKEAAGHLEEVGNSAGSTQKAFETMMESTENQLALLSNNITAALRPMGTAILKEVSDIAKAFNEAFANGDVQRSMQTLGELIVTITSAMVIYKGSIIGVTAAKTAYHAITVWITRQKAIEAANLVLTKGLYAAEATMIAKNTAMHVLLTNALKAQFAASLKASAALLANPYILAAVGVTALGYGIYKYATRATEAEKATRKYNEAKKEAAELDVKHKQTLEDLLKTLQDEHTSSIERTKAMEAIRAAYPALFQKYIDEKGHVKDLTALWKDYNEEVSKGKVQSNKKNITDIDTSINIAQNNLNSAKANSDWGSVRKYKEQLEGLKAQRLLAQKDVREDELIQWQIDLKKSTDAQISAELSEMKRLQQARKDNKHYSLNVGIGSLKGATTDVELQRRINVLESEQSARSQSSAGGKTSNIYDKDYKEAKAAWEKTKAALSEISKDRSKFTTEEYKKAKDDADKAEKAFKDLGGVTDASKLNSQVTKANELQAANNKLNEMKTQQSRERIRMEEDLANQEEQSRISSIADSYEKEQAQRKLNNKMEIQSLKRQKEDYIQAVIQMEKEAFEAQEDIKAKNTPGYNKKSFDSSSVSVDTSGFDTIINSTSKRQQNEKIRSQEEAWNEYLLKFGNYQKKRQAIIEKYDKEIKEAGTAGTAATLEKEKLNALDQLDNSVKGSTTLMGQLFADASRKSVGEIQKIIDRAELLAEYLSAQKDEEGNVTIGGQTYSRGDILALGVSENTIQNLEDSPEEVEALTNAIKKLKGELGSKSPFKLLEGQIKDAVKKIKEGGKDNIVQGITEIGNAVVSFSPAISQFGKDLGNIFGSDDFGSKIDGIADALGGLGQTAAGVGQIMSGDIVGGSMSAVSGISSVVSALDGLFGADYSQYNEMKAQYDALDDIWDNLIDKKKKYIEMSYGMEADKAGEEAKKLIDEQEKRYRELLKQLASSGKSIGSHSLGVRIYKRLNNDDWKRISEAVGETITHEYQFWDLEADQLEKLLNDPKIVSVLNTVNKDFVNYIQQIVDGSAKIEEIESSVKESLTQTSFDTVRNSFYDSLLDMKSDAEDFSDDFATYFQQAIIKTKLAKTFDSKLEEWYNQFSEANKDGINTDEYRDLRDDWDNMVSDALAQRDALKEMFGWSTDEDTSKEKGVTGKLEAALTEGTANEVLGTMNMQAIDLRSLKEMSSNHFQEAKACYLDVASILEQTRQIAVNTKATADSNQQIYEKLEEGMKDIKSELSTISKNTKSDTGRR
ncbi:phage tail tape measure protein [Phocaeicola sp.]